MTTNIFIGERASLKVREGERLEVAGVNSTTDFVTRKLLGAAGIQVIVDLGDKGVNFNLNGRKINLSRVQASLDVAQDGNEFRMFRHAETKYTTGMGVEVRIVPERKSKTSR